MKHYDLYLYRNSKQIIEKADSYVIEAKNIAEAVIKSRTYFKDYETECIDSCFIIRDSAECDATFPYRELAHFNRTSDGRLCALICNPIIL